MCTSAHGRHNHVVFRKLALESRALFVGVEISAGSSSVGGLPLLQTFFDQPFIPSPEEEARILRRHDIASYPMKTRKTWIPAFAGMTDKDAYPMVIRRTRYQLSGAARRGPGVFVRGSKWACAVPRPGTNVDVSGT